MSAKVGNHEWAHKNARKAEHFAQAHRDQLAAKEDHAEIASFDAEVNPMFEHLENILASTKKSELAKADDASKKVNNNPGRDSRFEYKQFNTLNPTDQIKARHAFGHSKEPMEKYHYAVEPKSGQMVHGQRWLAPDSPPEASVAVRSASKPEAPKMPGSEPGIMPQHKAGAAVVINAPGHDFHGSLGIVQMPNPSMESQIKVKVRNRSAGRFEDTYVQPHQVLLNKPIKKSQTTSSTLKKSKAALKSIKARKKK